MLIVPRATGRRVMPSVQPLEVVRRPSIRTFKNDVGSVKSRAWRCPWLMGRDNSLGAGSSSSTIDILQMAAEEAIEQFVLGAGMIVAEPPEPVASLGNVQFFPGAAQLLRRFLAATRRTDQVRAHVSNSRSQARLHSGWPIQMPKLC